MLLLVRIRQPLDTISSTSMSMYCTRWFSGKAGNSSRWFPLHNELGNGMELDLFNDGTDPIYSIPCYNGEAFQLVSPSRFPQELETNQHRPKSTVEAVTWSFQFNMRRSSNGNTFRVTGHLCGEFTGPRWIPRTKASDAERWCFLWSAPE